MKPRDCIIMTFPQTLFLYQTLAESLNEDGSLRLQGFRLREGRNTGKVCHPGPGHTYRKGFSHQHNLKSLFVPVKVLVFFTFLLLS